MGGSCPIDREKHGALSKRPAAPRRYAGLLVNVAEVNQPLVVVNLHIATLERVLAGVVTSVESHPVGVDSFSRLRQILDIDPEHV
jgi:hypothetical protein